MTECKNCKTELTEMKDDKGKVKCLRCLKCNPLTRYTPPAEKETRYVDIKMSEETVIEIIDRVVPDMVRGILENWHIQKPPVTKDESPETWREQAKSLEIEVYDKVNKKPRLKVDVLKDIDEKLKAPQ